MMNCFSTAIVLLRIAVVEATKLYSNLSQLALPLNSSEDADKLVESSSTDSKGVEGTHLSSLSLNDLSIAALKFLYSLSPYTLLAGSKISG